MSYRNLQNTWSNNNSKLCNNCNIKENYSGPVTLSYPDWIRYVDEGKNVLYGSGGVIPGGTINIPFGGSGAVYKGSIYHPFYYVI